MKQSPSGLPGNLSEVFLAGDLRVDVGQQCVTRAGGEIALPKLSFQLLVVLLRAAPNVVSHDQLMGSVWPGLIVSPETLNKRVNLLREALGESAQEPRYIAGVRGRGYRLLAAVSVAAQPTLPADAPPPAQESAVQSVGASTPGPVASPPRTVDAKPYYRRWIVVCALVALTGAIAAGGYVVYRGSAERVPPPSGSPSRDAPASEVRGRTVAVLPFDNISADAADAYLASGLPEMILNRLSRINGLSVIARNSSFALETKSIDSHEIGRRLNSGYLISGSIQRQAGRLRVAVQLVDTAAGTQVWSARFDRALREIFDVEDEIADQVADALSVRLGRFDPKPVAGERSSNIEAYLAFLHGRTLLGRFTAAESDAAVPYFEKAIALDPHFAAAFASLYDAHLQAADQRHENLIPVRQRFRPLIDRALSIDPNSGSTHFAHAMWDSAPNDVRDAEFRRAAEIDPSNGRGLTAYAEFLDNEYLRAEEAARILQRALRIDPMSPRAHWHAAMRSLDEVGARMLEKNMLEVLQLDPDFVPALEHYGLYRYIFHGTLAESVQILEHAIALDPVNASLRHSAMAVYLDLGDEQAARSVAAGTPASARTTGLLSMYGGDWRRAARAAYDEAGWAYYDTCGNWLAAEALRDFAVKTGDLKRAITFITLKYYFADDPAAHFDVCNGSGAIVLSQLLAARGLAREAVKLRHAAAEWNDAHTEKYAGGLRRLAAAALMLDGKPDAALAALAESFPAGNYQQWWYTLNYDPVWLPLHDDPRFQAIAADVRRHIDAQRSELEGLRRSGAVPRR